MNEDSFSDINESRAKDNKWPIIPDYTIERKIGEGGMGVVFLAHHESLGRKDAIKFIHSTQNGNEKQLIRFRQEARIVANLRHQYIATIYNMSKTTENKYYFAMEYVEGETLEEKIKQKSMSIGEAIKITTAVLEALEYIHSYEYDVEINGQQQRKKGVIHRDIKPANIMICKSGVKLMDFGLVKLADARQLTSHGATLGTPYYMSYEQAMTPEKVDTRTDIYSLGVVLYEMLTGIVPFKGESLTATLL